MHATPHARLLFRTMPISHWLDPSADSGPKTGAVFWPKIWATKCDGRQWAFTLCGPIFGPENDPNFWPIFRSFRFFMTSRALGTIYCKNFRSDCKASQPRQAKPARQTRHTGQAKHARQTRQAKQPRQASVLENQEMTLGHDIT